MYCSSHLLYSASIWRKSEASSKPLSLGQSHNQLCTAATSVNLSQSSLPPLNTSCLLLDQSKCSYAAGPLCVVPSLTGSLFLQWLHDLFPHHQTPSSIAAQRFPRRFEASYQRSLSPSSPWPLSSPPSSYFPRVLLPLWGHCLLLPLRC